MRHSGHAPTSGRDLRCERLSLPGMSTPPPSTPRTAILLNGRFLDSPDDARLSAFDAGLQHGVGLFETMTGGVRPDTGEVWVHRLDEHIERLATSARELDLAESLNARALEESVLATLERSGLPRARIRLTITGGDLNLLTRAAESAGAGQRAVPPDPTLLIVAQPATAYPAPMYERGVAITLAQTRANPLNPFEGHKTLNYWWRLRELRQSAAKGGAEALVLSVTNHLASGCVSNLFLVKDGVLLTPIARGEEGRASNTPDAPEAFRPGGADDAPPADAPKQARGTYLASPVLPGITRQWAIDKAELKGRTVERRMLALDDLLGADEVFLTNSSWGVLPVVRVERTPVGASAGARDDDASPGPVARMLIEEWRAETA